MPFAGLPELTAVGGEPTFAEAMVNGEVVAILTFTPGAH
jgi:hypothetical protein